MSHERLVTSASPCIALQAHPDDFAPFVEDDLSFERYCSNMREDAAWGGHLELQALSLMLRRNICIHQASEIASIRRVRLHPSGE